MIQIGDIVSFVINDNEKTGEVLRFEIRHEKLHVIVRMEKPKINIAFQASEDRLTVINKKQITQLCRLN